MALHFGLFYEVDEVSDKNLKQFGICVASPYKNTFHENLSLAYYN